MSRQVQRIHFGVDDQIDQRYREVPFDLGRADSVEVTLRYDTAGAVVDLGCRDPHRWRGWSGGARERFVISPGAATPGYLPGDMPRGEWAVVLGLHRVPEQGVDVEVTITAPASGPVEVEAEAPPLGPVERASGRDLPAPAGTRWFAGDFHSHTVHSDGDQSVAQLTRRAAERGLDFLTITDHNTVSHHHLLPAVGAAFDTLVIPGQEITTERGHANAFGDIGWIDFRQPADRWQADVEARGGLLSINHPLYGDCAWQHPLAVLPSALEFWHISWFGDLRSTAMWSLWSRWRQDATLLGGSDFHRPGQGFPPGMPTTWVAAEELSTEAVLDAVAAGRTALAADPAPGSPTLVRVDDELVAVDGDGTVLVDLEGRRRQVRGDRARFVADRTTGARAGGVGPYRLESPQRDLLAVTR